jgi:hypothetical protein
MVYEDGLIVYNAGGRTGGLGCWATWRWKFEVVW